MLKNLLATTAVSALLITGALAQSNTSEPEKAPATEQMSPDQAPAEQMSPDQAPAEKMEAPAATDEKPAGDTAAAAPMDQETFLTEQTEDQIQASRYIGQTVYNRQDEAVGDINDLIFTKDGGVDAAVIGVGGFLGIGEKQVATAFDAIEVETAPDGEIRLVIDGTKEQLEAAPEFVSLSEQRAAAEAAAQQQEMKEQQSGTMAPTTTAPAGGASGDAAQPQ
ncbi:PRC-barrel domain-containing protein [Afifella sp. IM 167]|uniref:PRC-barrel domain-containing protein n=1 Tax=Afifella sp. IM 167 TaxID=2033586 RepID=UPI001CCBF2A9|nr:PRC-barrel domain-containing protein [Afifella sp. IM 167]MBZ8135215.1 photosystem reaction center subunit H [Afifella sp. IM 167]